MKTVFQMKIRPDTPHVMGFFFNEKSRISKSIETERDLRGEADRM